MSRIRESSNSSCKVPLSFYWTRLRTIALCLMFLNLKTFDQWNSHRPNVTSRQLLKFPFSDWYFKFTSASSTLRHTINHHQASYTLIYVIYLLKEINSHGKINQKAKLFLGTKSQNLIKNFQTIKSQNWNPFWMFSPPSHVWLLTLIAVEPTIAARSPLDLFLYHHRFDFSRGIQVFRSERRLLRICSLTEKIVRTRVLSCVINLNRCRLSRFARD